MALCAEGTHVACLPSRGSRGGRRPARVAKPIGGAAIMQPYEMKRRGSSLWIKGVLLAAAALAAVPAASNAAVTISTDLYGTAAEANRLAPDDVAGAPGYVASHWNLFSGKTMAAAPLSDSTGSAAAGVALSIGNAAPDTYLNSFSGTPSTGNAKLYYGGAGRDPWVGALTLTLTGLGAFTSYDVILYLEADFGDSNRIAQVTTSAAGSPIYYGHAPANTSGTAPFALVTSTNVASPSEGNLVKFSGLTDSTLTISFSAPQNFVYLTGFQVVGAVPEPAGLALLALVIPAMARRRCA